METLRLSGDELPIALWLSARTGASVDEDALLFDESIGAEILELLDYYSAMAFDDHDLQPWASDVAEGLRERILSQEPAISSPSMGVLRQPKSDLSGSLYSICKILYSDPSSWRKGTIDGVIFGHEEDMTFLYSIVYERNEFIGFQVYPCRPDQSFDGLVAAIKNAAATIDEDTKVICVDKMDQVGMVQMFREDVEPMPDEARSQILDKLETCFGIKVEV